MPNQAIYSDYILIYIWLITLIWQLRVKIFVIFWRSSISATWAGWEPDTEQTWHYDPPKNCKSNMMQHENTRHEKGTWFGLDLLKSVEHSGLGEGHCIWHLWRFSEGHWIKWWGAEFDRSTVNSQWMQNGSHWNVTLSRTQLSMFFSDRLLSLLSPVLIGVAFHLVSHLANDRIMHQVLRQWKCLQWTWRLLLVVASRC